MRQVTVIPEAQDRLFWGEPRTWSERTRRNWGGNKVGEELFWHKQRWDLGKREELCGWRVGDGGVGREGPMADGLGARLESKSAS